MKENKVVSVCPKCSKMDIYQSVSANKRILDGQKVELHTCPVCGERYIARTYGYYSILRFHGDNFMEQLESILEITPKYCEAFIQQIRECNTEEQLLKVVQNMHGDVVPLSNEEYRKMLDVSIIMTEDICDRMES